MIGRLRGTLIAKQPPSLLIEVGGIGYEVEAPMSTIYDLPGIGKEVILLTHHAVKEDSVTLYGFLHEAERALEPRLLRGLPQNRDLARARWDQIGHHPQQGRLAAAGRPQQAEEATAFDGEADILQRGDGAPLGDEAYREVVTADGGAPGQMRCIALARFHHGERSHRINRSSAAYRPSS